MTPVRRNLAWWQAAGALFLIAAGALSHFVYGWSGRSPVAALFCPVNESVWEHLKLGYYALLLFSAVEYPFVAKSVANYFFAKFAGVLALEACILGIFYSYTAILGHNLFLVDISSYIIGVAVCQFVIYRLWSARPLSRTANILGLTGYVAIALFFGIFTFATPKAGIFEDKNDHTFGIPQAP
jgi:hypothetical protein